MRPVSVSKSLFTINYWLQTGSFLLVLKMASGMLLKALSDKDEVASDSFYERFRSSVSLYSRNDQYKIVILHFFEKQHVEIIP